MQTREIQCEYYICEHSCKKGRDANFYGICQHCVKYVKKAGAKPNRVNTKKKKLENIRIKEA